MKQEMEYLELHRAKLSCVIGKKALNEEIASPPNVTSVEYALYNLLCAVEEIARHLELEKLGRK